MLQYINLIQTLKTLTVTAGHLLTSPLILKQLFKQTMDSLLLYCSKKFTLLFFSLNHDALYLFPSWYIYYLWINYSLIVNGVCQIRHSMSWFLDRVSIPCCISRCFEHSSAVTSGLCMAQDSNVTRARKNQLQVLIWGDLRSDLKQLGWS